MLYLTADTHLDHDNIRVHANRPYLTLDHMNHTIVRTWNSIVDSSDTVIIAGDLAWRNHMHWIGALNGKKIMIFGNHDKMSEEAREQFTEVIGSRKQPGTLERTFDNIPLCISHCPYASWNGSCHGVWHVHGHCHGSMEEYPDFLRADIGWDVWGQPVPWPVLQLKMRAREAAWRGRRKDMETAAGHVTCQQRVAATLAANQAVLSAWHTQTKS